MIEWKSYVGPYKISVLSPRKLNEVNTVTSSLVILDK